MAEDRHIYGEINNKTDLREVFKSIRGEVEKVDSRPALTELYRRAGYLITHTHAPSWKKKFGKDATELRQVGEDEFRKTARKINDRARSGLRRKVGGLTDERGYPGKGLSDVPATTQKYSQVVELPREAQNVRLHADVKSLPEKYRDALQDVR